MQSPKYPNTARKKLAQSTEKGGHATRNPAPIWLWIGDEVVNSTVIGAKQLYYQRN